MRINGSKEIENYIKIPLTKKHEIVLLAFFFLVSKICQCVRSGKAHSSILAEF